MWGLRNRRDNRAFSTVRDTLAVMCNGIQRCCYCEDSCADEVEHIHPKDIYPELVFVWTNYLYACGICNVEKRNDFAVFPVATADWVDIRRKPEDTVVPPVHGDSVLINPRHENPLDYLILDLRGTFTFHSLHSPGSREYARARYTIDILGLNTRPVLVASRKNEYRGYRDRLAQYIAGKQNGEPEDMLEQRIDSLQRCSHRTVWEEMKRQASRIDDLQPLFTSAPEALTW